MLYLAYLGSSIRSIPALARNGASWSVWKTLETSIQFLLAQMQACWWRRQTSSFSKASLKVILIGVGISDILLADIRVGIVQKIFVLLCQAVASVSILFDFSHQASVFRVVEIKQKSDWS